MSKRFLVEPGYLARVGGCWYDHRVTLIVVEDERVEVFRRAAAGKPSIRIGSHGYQDLDPASPPVGLSPFKSEDGMPLPPSAMSDESD